MTKSYPGIETRGISEAIPNGSRTPLVPERSGIGYKAACRPRPEISRNDAGVETPGVLRALTAGSGGAERAANTVITFVITDTTDTGATADEVDTVNKVIVAEIGVRNRYWSHSQSHQSYQIRNSRDVLHIQVLQENRNNIDRE